MPGLTDEEKAHYGKRTPLTHEEANRAHVEREALRHEALANMKEDPITIPHAQIFEACGRVPPERKKKNAVECILIEAERWVDARMFARTHFAGHLEPNIRLHHDETQRDRFQLRWQGSALDPRDPLRLEVRRIVKGKPKGEWKDHRQ